MIKSFLISLLATVVLITSAPTEAQQRGKVPQIGVLFPAAPAAFKLRTEALLQGLRELGHVDGQSIAIEWRWAENKVERLPELAAELVKLNVDVIVTNGTPATQAEKNATKTIPIVMVAIGDPIATGLIESLARPGGNVTGTSILAPELSGKRLELLREVVPNIARVTAILNPTNPTYRPELRDNLEAGKALGVQVQAIEVADLNALQAAFSTTGRDRIRGLLIFTDAILYSLRSQIVEQAELPVEQPLKFEFVVNLKAAKQIGLTVPPNVLVRADRVIR